jgi:hypothetical protein
MSDCIKKGKGKRETVDAVPNPPIPQSQPYQTNEWITLELMLIYNQKIMIYLKALVFVYD